MTLENTRSKSPYPVSCVCHFYSVIYTSKSGRNLKVSPANFVYLLLRYTFAMRSAAIDGASEREIGNPVTNSTRVPNIHIGKIALGKWQHELGMCLATSLRERRTLNLNDTGDVGASPGYLAQDSIFATVLCLLLSLKCVTRHLSASEQILLSFSCLLFFIH